MVDRGGEFLMTEAFEGILKGVGDFHQTLRVTAGDRGCSGRESSVQTLSHSR